MNINLWELVSTPEREQVLARLLYESAPINLHKIARDAGVSPSQVHKYVGICKKRKMIKDNKLADYPFVRALRVLENVIFLEKAGLVSLIRSRIKDAKGMGIYGGWAKGTNDENSDIDLWILVQRPLDDLESGKVRQALENRLARKVDLIFLTNEKIRQLKEKNPNLYYSLYHSLSLWGAESW